MATNHPDLPEILDYDEAAEHLGCGARWLYTLRGRGQMPPADVELGGSPGWLKETLDAWWPTRPRVGRPPKPKQQTS